MPPFHSQSRIFHDDEAARVALEALRWPGGAVCPHCAPERTTVAPIGGQGHREGLYGCATCRGQFTVTVGTALHRTRVSLSQWMRAVHMYSRLGEPPTLAEISQAVGVTYKTMLHMDKVITGALKTYKGYKDGFGTRARGIIREAQPAYAHAPKLKGYGARKTKLLDAGKHPSQHTPELIGVLASGDTPGAEAAILRRMERVAQQLVNAGPVRTTKRRRVAKRKRAAPI